MFQAIIRSDKVTPKWRPSMPQRASIINLSLIIALVLFSSSCASKTLAEPPAAYQNLKTQNYDFQTVWEVSLETMRTMGFRSNEKQRNGTERTGFVVSEMKITKPVAFFGTETAQRLRIEISPGEKVGQHKLRLAPTTWTREVTKNGTLLWKYQGPTKELAAEFEKKIEERFSARYSRKNGS